MIKKNPAKKNWLRFGLKLGAAGIAFELGALGLSYLFWRQLNTNQQFRKHCSENYPIVLEGYYKIGDFFDKENSQSLRQLDLEAFNQTKSDTKKPSE